MAVQTTLVNKPLNPRGNDQSPLAYNRAKLFSGKALSFDGVNDKVDLPTLSFDLYAFSFYYEGAINSGTGQFVFHTGDGTNDGVSIGSVTSLLTGETLTIGDNGNYTAITESFDDAIHFIVCTWNATENKYNFYLNAQKLSTINSGTDAPLISFSTAPAIGYRKAIGDMYLNGNISNVRAFNTALTAAQVADLYNNPEKVVPTGVDNTALKLWLPMQEGAGTTAYDGSGNGNHGTISGATYTHGIGAPVSQTAVIDWNKGTNLVSYSTALQGNWSLTGGTWTSGQDDPIGGTDAYKITATGSDPWLFKTATSGISGTQYTAKCWAKGNAGREARLWIIRDNIEFPYEDFTLTGDWQEIETTKTFGTTPVSYVSFRLDIPNDTTGSGDVGYIFAPRLVAGDNADVYIPTLATAQTSPVLLPQGLTTGRDITGVNLFENVRKQGALNLDGNSWAEVHDNASLDITSAITLECWFYDTDSGAFEGVIGKWKDSTERTYAIIKNNGSNNFLIRISTDGSAQAGPTITNTDYGWIHLVLTYDGASVKGYKNGVYQSQAALTGSIATNDKPVEIGRYGQSTGSQYNNQIAQPRIYNRALTAEEVQRNYNAGKNIYTN